MGSFAAKVEALTKKYQRQMRATMRGSVQKTVSIAQRIEDHGGRMHLDTGFLRASLSAHVGSMPSGESVNPDPKAGELTFQYEGEALQAALLRWEPGEVLYVGWTANYARPREARDGFLRGAVEQWDGTVDVVAATVKRGIK